MQDYRQYITSNPNILFGKPAIKDTRIPVELILDELAAGTTIDELLEEYPRLMRDAIYAALAFAADESLSPALPFAALTGSAASPRAKIHVASTRIHFLLEIGCVIGPTAQKLQDAVIAPANPAQIGRRIPECPNLNEPRTRTASDNKTEERVHSRGSGGIGQSNRSCCNLTEPGRTRTAHERYACRLNLP